MPRRTRKPKGPKRVVYELIDRDSIIGQPMYRLLRGLVAEHHEEIREARIALAWNTSWKPDVDGRVTLGKCKKASDLDRELAAYDFIILLRRSFWTAKEVTDVQRTALLDHELSHATVRIDERTEEPVRDERGRLVFRMRKHDIEEFSHVVARYGCYKSDIEHFAAQLFARAGKFEPCDSCTDSPGWAAQTDSAGTRVKRCQCWITWRERATEAKQINDERRASA